MKSLRIRHCIITAAISAFVMVSAAAENATDGLEPRIRGLLQDEMIEIEAAKQLDLFENMTESCLQCHQSYASGRFRGLTQ